MKKVTFNLKLNTLVLVLFVLNFSADLVIAQNKKVEIYGKKLEKKADKSSYAVYDQGERYYLHNKSNTLMIYESSKETKSEYTQLNWDNYIEFFDKEKISPLVHKSVAPFYQRFKSKYSEKLPEFKIILFAKPDGKVCELAFSYSKASNIPLATIEKLEKDILSLGLRLEFDREHYYFNDAIWIDYSLKYSVFSMKEKLKAEKERDK